jgi:hypothetical protein
MTYRALNIICAGRIIDRPYHLKPLRSRQLVDKRPVIRVAVVDTPHRVAGREGVIPETRGVLHLAPRQEVGAVLEVAEGRDVGAVDGWADIGAPHRRIAIWFACWIVKSMQ